MITKTPSPDHLPADKQDRTTSPKFALVAVEIPSLTSPLLFKTNGLEVLTGDVVAVPIKNSFKAGVVTSLLDDIPPSLIQKNNTLIKPILEVAGKKILSEDQIKLADQISKYYCCPFIEAIKLFLPASYSLKLVKSDKADGLSSFKFAKPQISEKTVTTVSLKCEPEKPTTKQSAVIECLKAKGEILKSDLVDLSGASLAVISNLEKRGYINFTKTGIDRLPTDHYFEDYGKPKLNKEQESAYLQIKKSLIKGKNDVFLLFGVTASGKTEVYLRCIEDCLQSGKTAIFLLPEISLTPQVSSRLKSRFGDKIAILHSAMSAGERFDQHKGIKDGRYKIVVGPRSAIFAPLDNIGLIVVDEEQEASYKQNRSPRYDARKIALMRAENAESVLIFGSATPSIETFFHATEGRYKMLTLSERAVGSKAKVSLVDLRTEPNKGDCLSRYLRRKIKELPENEKAVILLNRRGFSGFIICRKCGHVPKCPNCDVSLTLHGKYLICHYCNKILTFKNNCSECNAPLNKFLAAGTQRVEWEINRENKDLFVVRMDADTTTAKGGHGQRLAEFRGKRKAVLVGTQMIAKGLDYPDVSVVGAVNTDIGLNMPDFRSSERVFQLIHQLCGRAGRGDITSEVVLQTYEPENNTIIDIIKGDFIKFFNHEISRRKELDYPPFSKLINIGIRGKDRIKVRQTAKNIAEKIKNLNNPGILSLLGPASAPIAYIKNEYRWHILMKTTLDFSNYPQICNVVNSCKRKEIIVIIDVDPTSML